MEHNQNSIVDRIVAVARECRDIQNQLDLACYDIPFIDRDWSAMAMEEVEAAEACMLSCLKYITKAFEEADEAQSESYYRLHKVRQYEIEEGPE